MKMLIMNYLFVTKVPFLSAFVCALVLTSMTFLFLGTVVNAQMSSTNSSSSPLLSGIISSLLLDILPGTENSTSDSLYTSSFNITNVPKFILAGEWNIKLNSGSNIINTNLVDNLKVVDITADFVGITTDGKGSHSHQISNFTPISKIPVTTNQANDSSSNISSRAPIANVLSLDGNAYILGTVDVGINNNRIWEDVKANITISNGKTIVIQLDDKAVGYHFGKGQAIYGLVNGLYMQ
jgi:hypothetical protein